MSAAIEVRDRVRRYYTAYYRDPLRLPDWATLVSLREREEESLEPPHVERVRGLLGGDALAGRVLTSGLSPTLAGPVIQPVFHRA